MTGMHYMRSRGGFTLLEVLIATLLFAVGVVSVSWVLSAAFVSGSDVENTMIASNLTQGRLEELRNIDYELVNDEARAAVSGFAGFQRMVAVDEPLTDLKMVTVTVYWAFRGPEANASLATYISKN